MGRHEGPKALISERTPRQTEREEKRVKDRQKKRRVKGVREAKKARGET